MFNFTCDEQHLSNATNNSNLGNEMASQPLISNTFLGGACVASANERPITNVSEPGLCKRVGQSWHSSLWLLQTSSCLMWRILGPIWACVRTVCAFQVQTSRACCLTCRESKSCDEQHPVWSNTFCSAPWCVARQRFYCRLHVLFLWAYFGRTPVGNLAFWVHLYHGL